MAGHGRSTDWLVEVHVDRRWYELRRSPEPIPAPGRPRTRALDVDSLLLGRGPGPQVDLDLSPDHGVSRRHARLVRRREDWWVEDLSSHNGTWVSLDGLRCRAGRSARR
ncbi:FHA domain-containing protein [Luteococcus peritonei]|uniref:FHA domain-containing protein n=1 Tax=Luteococcus peritonei TaxID=88874 RepID=A0ABW4RRR1_9ACTN